MTGDAEEGSARASVTLATKVYVAGDARARAIDSMESLIANQLGALDVEWELAVEEHSFPTVTLSGRDADAGRSVLDREWATIVDRRTTGERYVGTLERWDERGLVLDAGAPVRIPTEDIGLGPGSPSQIRDRFGLVQHLPLSFVSTTGTDAGRSVESPDGDSAPTATDPGEDSGPSAAVDRAALDDPTVEPRERGRLSDETLDRLYEWRRGPGRVNVNSATRSAVRATLNRAGHARDVVTVERLGLLEQSVICAEGTDPPGLLASVGRYLQAELLCVIPE